MTQSSTSVSINTYHAQPYQRAVHDGLAKHWSGSTHCVKAVRQSGKSLMCENVLLKCSLENKGETSIMVSPTLKQCRECFKALKRACSPSLITLANAQLLEIEFCTGSRVIFLSAEQGDNLRGFTVTKNGILIIDEAAYIKDDIYYLCTPFVNANNAPTLIVSTPRFRSGFFYDIFTDTSGMVHSYDFTEYTNPYLTKEKLEFYRTKMPINLFRADYLGEWMEATSELFGDFASVMSQSYEYKGGTVAGIDWGVGKSAKSADSDSTAVSIMSEDNNQVALLHFNDLSATDTIKRIVEAFRKYNVKRAFVETNSIGSVYLELLRKEVRRMGLICAITGFNTSNATKREIIEGLVVDIQNKTIGLLNDNELKVQMSAYTMERTPSGQITYNAASGYHDDCIIATALSNHGNKKGGLSWM